MVSLHFFRSPSWIPTFLNGFIPPTTTVPYLHLLYINSLSLLRSTTVSYLHLLYINFLSPLRYREFSRNFLLEQNPIIVIVSSDSILSPVTVVFTWDILCKGRSFPLRPVGLGILVRSSTG